MLCFNSYNHSLGRWGKSFPYFQIKKLGFVAAHSDEFLVSKQSLDPRFCEHSCEFSHYSILFS